MKTPIILLLAAMLVSGCQLRNERRKEISLNGTWEITKTNSGEKKPSTFEARIPVPGLVDLASPKIDTQDTAYANSIYWYRRSFTIRNPHPRLVHLKINKSAYHTRIFVNGKLAGDNPRCFTPSVVDILPFVKGNGEENELVIAVGCRNELPDSVANGWDYEKIKYTPGIYDDVKLIVSGYPYISNVQTAPDVARQQLKVRTEVVRDVPGKRINLTYLVKEVSSGKVIAQGKIKENDKEGFPVKVIDFTVKLPGCHLWSPEDPFLYHLELRTSGDNASVRFGMRTFAGSKDGVFLLNGKPYYMRGTNVCIFRFFEDPDRAQLPWNSEWITRLHDRFKEMHWNSMRYCIGFPPEKWYETADSIGLLIQDEFPVWTGVQGGFAAYMKGITAQQLAGEYAQWMRERWNHPSVVIWDAQNESVNDTTGKAIRLVRSLDLSNRPWDNGYAAPVAETDVLESHPYLFIRYMQQKPAPEGYLSELMGKPQDPGNDPNQWTPLTNGARYPNPVIINEYGWLWLNRNGTTTTLTDQVYANVFPEAKTPEQRLEVYAKNLAMLTEYWRAHRRAGAVMHFCGLGYSRPEKPRGQTSDNFIDIRNLTFEPHFYRYLKPAFSPVAPMIDFWSNSIRLGQSVVIPVYLINDTYAPADGFLRMDVYLENTLLFSKSYPYQLPGPGRMILQAPLSVPAKGTCRLEAIVTYKGDTIRSIRNFKIE